MYLIPAPDMKVPDPDRGGVLPPEGREVQPSTYWHYRVACGDVSDASALAAPAPEAPAPKSK